MEFLAAILGSQNCLNCPALRARKRRKRRKKQMHLISGKIPDCFRSTSSSVRKQIAECTSLKIPGFGSSGKLERDHWRKLGART